MQHEKELIRPLELVLFLNAKSQVIFLFKTPSLFEKQDNIPVDTLHRFVVSAQADVDASSYNCGLFALEQGEPDLYCKRRGR